MAEKEGDSTGDAQAIARIALKSISVIDRGNQMNGLEIAELVGSLVSRLAPLVVAGIHLGASVDPVLERQMASAIELANQSLLDADKRFANMDKLTDDRLK